VAPKSLFINLANVNKLFAISISFLVLLQSFGLHYTDVVQLDEFIEHAKFHSEQYGDNVLVFISKHYGDLKADHEKQHQEEKEDHEQLPFQHQGHVSPVTAITLYNNTTELDILEFVEYNGANFFYQAPSSSLHAQGLFQPPKTL
jgi:hypothetical protein